MIVAIGSNGAIKITDEPHFNEGLEVFKSLYEKFHKLNPEKYDLKGFILLASDLVEDEDCEDIDKYIQNYEFIETFLPIYDGIPEEIEIYDCEVKNKIDL
jgi:hypothetical protein